MRFHYAGKFKGVESLKAQREPGPSDVKFKEPEYKKFAVIANAGSIVLAIALYLAIPKQMRQQSLFSKLLSLPILVWKMILNIIR